MNGLAAVFLVAAGVAAAVDWAAVGFKSKPWEYVGKPLALACLIVVAATLDPAIPDRRVWFLVALGLSLLGDFFLMLPKDLFVFGLASFLGAHIAYIIGFSVDPAGAGATLVAGAIVVVILGIVGSQILRGVAATDRAMGPPVVLYMIAIAAMATRALATGDGLAVAGASLFVASDSLIAWNRFVAPRPWMPLAIIVTYHVGQALLTLSLI
jgi:uncharacterized membrane protein YhhN